MKAYIYILTVLILWGGYLSPLAGREVLTFRSGKTRVTLLELFTSQGCSSTPPAEKYLNRLVSHPELWKSFVPVAYHVDYWNSLGWRDPYSSRAYTDRQKEYRRAKVIPNLYTPGFMVNGKPWIGWHLDHPLPRSSGEGGELSARVKPGNLTVNYTGAGDEIQLNVAILGFNINTDIKSGENRNRKYRQDFVVLKMNVYKPGKGSWKVRLPRVDFREAEGIGIALWVNRVNDPVPLQAAGGWVTGEFFPEGP